jgi:hypothetical protein
MKYLCLAYLDRGLAPGPDAFAQYGALRQAMHERGVFVDMGQLASQTGSKTIRVTDGSSTVADGPPHGNATATAAPVAYFLIDCNGLDEALDWAARVPAAAYGSIEVRPVR